MENDPFYRQIVERLNGQLDDQQFEACAADLLGGIFPGLVPYPGGDDSGMDGAIPDWEGEPFPLVVTTSKDAIGNLTRNLIKYTADGRKRRKAVFATSRPLTVRRINNLHDRAEELGFVLVNVVHQEWFAGALYRHPEWCQSLLGLSGRPAALSVIPNTSRPLLDQPMVGRDEDLAWLTSTLGDRLLIGQPGCGKTFILHQFAMTGSALFVVSEDLQEVANGIRSLEPKTLIVDDAHTKINLLQDLKRLRLELQADFDILASSWPGERDQITDTLNLSVAAIHGLPLLERGRIVEVVKGTGIRGPATLVREIVDQSDGRPGLAVTLAHACLSGSTRDLVLGDVLSRAVRSFFVPTLGRDVVEILAAFAVGGDAGMRKEVVAQELGLPLVELRSIASHLAAGGLLFERKDCLAVYPRALRQALVRDVFFRGTAVSLSIDPLVRQAPDSWDVAETLIGVYARGGTEAAELVWNLCVQLNSDELWQRYAWIGKAEVARVLRQLPKKTEIVAQAALQYAPETVLWSLFEASLGDTRQLHATPDHPMRVIRDWVLSAVPGAGFAISRRQVLVQEACRWLANDGDIQVGLQALREAFSPRFEDHYEDPGNRAAISVRFVSLTVSEIEQLQALWPTAREQLRAVEIANWEPIFRLVEDWVYPGRIIAPLADDIYAGMKQFGVTLLQDIVVLAVNRPGVLRWATRLAVHVKVDVEVPENAEFELLYPIEDLEDWKAAEEKNAAAARALALAWSQCSAEDIIPRMALYEQEARMANLSYPRLSPMVCTIIAKQVTAPLVWAIDMKKAGVPIDLVHPFLMKAIEIGESGWVIFVTECLAHPATEWVAVSAVLELEKPSVELFDSVAPKLPSYTQMIEVMCLRGQVPIETIRRLLRHSDAVVASAAAHGEWLCDPKKQIRTELMDDWRQAVVLTDQEDYWLRDVFRADPDLAFEWLRRQIDNGTVGAIREDETIAAAVDGLSMGTKRDLLITIPASWEYEELVKQLVGDDIGLYQVLLDRVDMERFHLTPLVGYPDEGNWAERAIMALDHEYLPEKIALAVHRVGVMTITWSGDESDLWHEWMNRFATLQSHQDERIRHIGEIGQNRMISNRKRASEEEKLEAIYGFDDSRVLAIGGWTRVRR